MYVSVAEFLAETTLTATQELTEERITRALVYAEQLFDRLTQRDKYGMWCLPRRKTFALDGRGHDTIQLPYPIVAILEVKVSGTEVSCVPYYRFMATANGEPFPNGTQNVVVDGLWGDKKAMVITVKENGENYEPQQPVKEFVIRVAEKKITHEKVFSDERVYRIGPMQEIRIGSIMGDATLDGILESYRVKPQVTLEVR